jgi:hypothetical protein
MAICLAEPGIEPPIAERMPPVPLRVALPVGDWKIEFANGVVEKCSIRADGAASVTEPLRSADGTVTRGPDSVVISFGDNRTERWTRIGDRIVVEHWCPSSEYPAGARVLGIGDLLEEMTP